MNNPAPFNSNCGFYLPQKVVDALARGFIPPEGFVYLAMLYKRAANQPRLDDDITKIWKGPGPPPNIRGFSAAEFIRYDLGQEPTDANLKAARRLGAVLRACGWYTWDYVEGSHRPYNIWLAHYSTDMKNTLPGVSRTGTSGTGGVRYESQGGVPEEAHATLHRMRRWKEGTRIVSLRKQAKVSLKEKRTPSEPNNGAQIPSDAGVADYDQANPAASLALRAVPSASADSKPPESSVSLVPPLQSSDASGLTRGEDTTTSTPTSTDAQEPLYKSMGRIAAKVLHNPRGVPKNLKFKFELIATSYTATVVEQDFEKWCNENPIEKQALDWPVIDYLKVVSRRLGSGDFTHAIPNRKDPRVTEVSSHCYDNFEILPPVVGVAELLVSFTPAEIKAALDEYITPIDGTADRAAGIKAFFSEGGGAAIIHVRRSREPAAPKATGALGELRHSSDSDAIAKREKETAEKRAKAEAALKAKQAAEKLAIEKAAADKAAAEAIAAAEKARIAEEQARIAEEKRVREAAESEQRNAKIRAEREAAEVKRAAERDQKQMGFECRHHGKCDAHLVPFVYTTVGVCPDMQCAHEDCVAQLDKDGSVQYRAHIAQGAGNTDCLLCQRQASAPSAAEELAAVQQ